MNGFEEANVSRKIRDFLVQNGYEIKIFCEDKREKGHDIKAIKDGRKIIMEVKGYPSDKYVKGPDRGTRKERIRIHRQNTGSGKLFYLC